MTNWEYKCDLCNYHVVSNKKIKYLVSYTCTTCKQGTIIDISPPNGATFEIYVEKTPVTIGDQANYNTKRMGHYEKQEKEGDRTKRIKQASEKMEKESGGKSIQHS